LASNDAQFDLPFQLPARADLSALREGLRLWNSLPNEVIDLDKKDFYNFLKSTENLQALLQNFPVYQIN
jgi:hypothetical protein